MQGCMPAQLGDERLQAKALPWPSQQKPPASLHGVAVLDVLSFLVTLFLGHLPRRPCYVVHRPWRQRESNAFSKCLGILVFYFYLDGFISGDRKVLRAAT